MGFGKDGKGVIITEQRSASLGTQSGDSAALIGTKLVTLERFRMLKSQVTATIIASTGTEAARLTLYLADGDLTTAEIEEALEAQGPLGPNDNVLSEQAMRPVFRVDGHFEVSGADPIATGAVNTAILVGSVNPRWTFARTKSWNWVIFNTGSALTTGATVKILAKDFGVWVT